MRLLLTKNKKPLHVAQDDFLDAFEEFSSSADSVHISTGYLSVAALQYLIENVKNDALPYLHLTIGMHHFDGFTRAQYDSALSLASYLNQEKKGSTSICKAFPYHGKVYGFYKNQKPYAAILGSSNLSSLTPKSSYNFEVDTVIEDPKMLNQLSHFQNELNEKACVPFLDWKPNAFNETAEIPGAEKVKLSELNNFWSLKQSNKFKLLLKPEEKSNLNIFFGRGRGDQKKKFFRPRSWYEAEIIVSNNITSQSDYPRESTFRVVTDDGWSFMCTTNGDYSKNFRSSKGLSVLGYWVKGRLEEAGIVKYGDKIISEMLLRYGTNHVELIKTEQDNLWLLNFNKDQGFI
jgi:HKD family nuclease